MRLGDKMSALGWLFAGAFLCNCIPHLAAGLRGEPFPTPFAKPRGVGHSSPLVNVLWGAFNLAAGLALACSGSGANDRAMRLAAAGAGFLVLAMYLAVHFGRVRAEEARRLKEERS